MLVAGAGYGKTMALEEALGSGEPRAVWLSCAGRGQDHGLLLLGLIERIRAAVPGLADVVGDQLAALPEPVDVSLIAHTLRDELERLLVEPLVLVFDDAEELEGSKRGIELLEIFLRPHSGALRVAVATRRPLPLRSAKLEVSGWLTEFGSADLAFREEECAALLQAQRGRTATPDEVREVMARTEGWPLAVALSSPGDTRTEAVGRQTRDALFAYLSEEVLDRLGPELRSAVLDSSLPRELTPTLIAALGLPDDFVPRAERAGLVLKAAQDQREAWSYHPLFREFLLERLAAERSDAERLRLHTATAGELAASDRQVEAIEHWLEARRWEEAVAAMELSGPELVGTSPDAVRRWLARLPAEARAQAPCLLLEGLLAWGDGLHDQATPLLRAAVRAYAERGDEPREWLARSMLEDVLFSLGRFNEMVEIAEGFENVSPAASVGAAGAGWYAAVSLAARGFIEEAAEIVDALRADATTASMHRYLSAIVRAFSLAPQGRLDLAAEEQRRAIDVLDVVDPLGRMPYAIATLALIEADRGDFVEALALWDRCLEQSQRLGVGFVVKESHLQRAFLHARAGRIVEAEADFARGRDRRGTGWRDVILHQAEAFILALRGDPAGAVSAAERALGAVDPAPVNFRVWASCELAAVLADGGARSLAAAAIERTLEALDAAFPGQNGSFYRARLLAVRAWLRHLAGEAAAYDDLARALGEAADTAGYVLGREWPRLEPLVWGALERHILDPDIVVAALERVLPGGAALVPLVEHPVAAVRGAAVGPAAASGHPQLLARLDDLARDPDQGVASAAVAIRERTRAAPPPLTFELLGGFRVRRASWAVDDASWGRPIAARVMRFLLVHHEDAVAEDLLFEAFWPARPPEAARRSLTVALSLARGVLDTPGAEHSVIETRERAYRVRLGEHDRLDVAEFERAAAAGLAAPAESARPLLERADALWTGEPLPEDRYAVWAIAWRERLMHRYLQVLAALAEVHTRSGEHLDTIRVARKMIELDPLNESSHRDLMAAYAHAGRRSHALRQYLECRRVLVDELGIEPGDETRSLHARILAGVWVVLAVLVNAGGRLDVPEVLALSVY